MPRSLSLLLLTAALAGCASAVVPPSTPAPTPTTAPTPRANASTEVAGYVAHVDAAAPAIVAKLATPAASDSDRLAIYSAVADLATTEASWAATQPIPPCLTAAASQYQSTITALKSAMDLGVGAFTEADQAAMTQAVSEAAKGRAALIAARLTVDTAAGAC